jgi:hypothetical protein
MIALNICKKNKLITKSKSFQQKINNKILHEKDNFSMQKEQI